MTHGSPKVTAGWSLRHCECLVFVSWQWEANRTVKDHIVAGFFYLFGFRVLFCPEDQTAPFFQTMESFGFQEDKSTPPALKLPL